jgi:hypothetical protein
MKIILKLTENKRRGDNYKQDAREEKIIDPYFTCHGSSKTPQQAENKYTLQPHSADLGFPFQHGS